MGAGGDVEPAAAGGVVAGRPWDGGLLDASLPARASRDIRLDLEPAPGDLGAAYLHAQRPGMMAPGVERLLTVAVSGRPARFSSVHGPGIGGPVQGCALGPGTARGSTLARLGAVRVQIIVALIPGPGGRAREAAVADGDGAGQVVGGAISPQHVERLDVIDAAPHVEVLTRLGFAKDEGDGAPPVPRHPFGPRPNLDHGRSEGRHLEERGAVRFGCRRCRTSGRRRGGTGGGSDCCGCPPRPGKDRPASARPRRRPDCAGTPGWRVDEFGELVAIVELRHQSEGKIVLPLDRSTGPSITSW